MNNLSRLLFTGTMGLLLSASTNLTASITLDFDTDANGNAIQAGQVIDNEYAPWGVHISTENFQKSFDLGIAFDSENPTGGDGDLRTGAGSYGIGNDPNDPLGNVLIISERSYDGNGDGLIDVPDDEGGQFAGYFQFDFDIAMLSGQVTLLDIEEHGGGIRFYNNGSALLAEDIYSAAIGDNSRQTLSFSGFEFDSMRIYLKGSGAVDNLVVVPTPEPSTLLLLGSAGIAVVRRKMKSTTA